MRPRVFVSSTYYDLKYIRNSLELFIKQYGFEPVLFESGNVIFEHDRPLDEACYNEVKLCHLMILIIGGRYGSSANINENEYISNYEKGYISITRKEFKTAKEQNIPTFIFIDKNVYAEYETFKNNKAFFYNEVNKCEKCDFKFAHADSINIFEFIDELKINAMCTFERFQDIENYLKNQWAGMFYLYLVDIQNKKQSMEIIDSVSEIKNISDRMNQMLNELGKTILSDSGVYEKIIKEQNHTLLKFFAEQAVGNIKFEAEFGTPADNFKLMSELVYDNILENKFCGTNVVNAKKYEEFKTKWDEIISEMNNQLIDLKMKIISINRLAIYSSYQKEIKPIIIKDVEYKRSLLEYLAYEFCDKASPF